MKPFTISMMAFMLYKLCLIKIISKLNYKFRPKYVRYFSVTMVTENLAPTRKFVHSESKTLDGLKLENKPPADATRHELGWGRGRRPTLEPMGAPGE